MTTINSKTELRQAARKTRATAAQDLSPSVAGRLLLQQAIPLFLTDHAPVPVGGYWPIGDEIDPRPLLEWLHRRYWPIALPSVATADRPLSFRQWYPGDTLVKAYAGIFEPLPSAPAFSPHILLVPLLAFDRAGHRLGYGGGFYDRTLEDLRRDNPDMLAYGLAYSAQEIDHVPPLPTDMILDGVITERSVLTFRS